MNTPTSVLRLSSGQCRRARALLKWNLNDLASRTHVPLRTLQKFEHNLTRLIKSENEALFFLFSRHGVEFASDGVVTLHGSATDQDFFYTGKEYKTFDLEVDPLTPIPSEKNDTDPQKPLKKGDEPLPKPTTKP
jgi:hypothetical protein